MQTSSPDGLRERKKAQVRADLERATLELALERDLDEVTVDEICSRVPVSHRTFFNYFDTKEDALFDIRRAWGDPEWIGRRLADAYQGSVVGALVDTLFTASLPDEQDAELREARMLIAARHAGLLRRRLGRFDDLRSGLVAAVSAFLADVAADDVAAPDAPPGEADAAAQAELLVVACIAALRIAVREWASAGGSGSAADVAERAVTIARSIAPFVR
ncbi:TetR/AcrR family transcriptional regulator [Leifsonia sp. 21MFCrub1.1]|uniref:TetR/AcrR family transcriptional regulator n=1 Tax=Leifsonia sp. 21MFCrub1.1 TaxID=1798223 RepID=UPI0008929D19|nr:TetR family transcriptional regulator [Leifsonia sp. 21MFCrub1.1]SEB12002.1 regulatory protein, tetR family [Leifsonia sp. 21MFCrub1.1]